MSATPQQIAETVALLSGQPPEVIAAAIAALSTEASPAQPADNAAKTAAKARTVRIPQWEHTDEAGNKWRLSQAYESKPGQDDSTKYRVPRVLIECKAKGGDNYRKVTTLLPSWIDVVRAIPDGKVAEFATDARVA